MKVRRPTTSPRFSATEKMSRYPLFDQIKALRVVEQERPVCPGLEAAYGRALNEGDVSGMGSVRGNQHAVGTVLRHQAVMDAALDDFGRPSRTTISSASRMVLTRWATIRHVQPRRRRQSSMASSVTGSSAAVASSSTKDGRVERECPARSPSADAARR